MGGKRKVSLGWTLTSKEAGHKKYKSVVGGGDGKVAAKSFQINFLHIARVFFVVSVKAHSFLTPPRLLLLSYQICPQTHAGWKVKRTKNKKNKKVAHGNDLWLVGQELIIWIGKYDSNYCTKRERESPLIDNIYGNFVNFIFIPYHYPFFDKIKLL